MAPAVHSRTHPACLARDEPLYRARSAENNGRMRLDFYYDIVCPYAALASTQVEALAARTGAELRWVPVLLGGLFRAVGAPTNPAAQMNPAKARHNLRDIARSAEHRGVPLVVPDAHPRRTVEAMRLITAAHGPARMALSHALFRAYWIEGRDVADPAVLDALAREHGIDPAARADAGVKSALFDATSEAASRGAFGVPALVVDEKHLFWGQDRLHFVEQALGGQPGPLWTPPAQVPPGPRPTLRLFHDFSSPFSYLGHSQASRLAHEFGATLELRPMLLGALFREVGTAGVPLFEMSPPKQKAVAADLGRWATWWGTPYRFPKVFPQRTVQALRVAIAAPGLTGALYRALWAEGHDLGDPADLRGVVDAAFQAGAPAPLEAGDDRTTWTDWTLARAEDADVKAALRANTEAARALGGFGAPTFEVVWPDGTSELFWGQDRLNHVAAALAR